MQHLQSFPFNDNLYISNTILHAQRTEASSGRAVVEVDSEEMFSFHLRRRITPEILHRGSLPEGLETRFRLVGPQHRLAMLSHEGASSSSMGDDPP